jgi:hypothetical protein
MRRTNTGAITLIYNKIEVRLDRGGVFAALSDKELFMCLCGMLHVEPFRFLDENEIHNALGELWLPLTYQESVRFLPDAEEWVTLRARNKKSPAPATIAWTKPKVFTASEVSQLTRTAFEWVKSWACCITTPMYKCPPIFGSNYWCNDSSKDRGAD